MFRKIVPFLLCFLPLAESSILDYRTINQFSLGSPAVSEAGLGGLDNPALLSDYDQADLIYYSNANTTGLHFVLPNLAYGKVMHSRAQGDFTDHILAFSAGSRELSFGLGKGWFDGQNVLNRENYESYGFVYRPTAYISVAGSKKYAASDCDEYLEVAWRPFGTNQLSSYVDYSRYNQDLASYGLGLNYKPIQALSLFAKVNDKSTYSLGLSFQLDSLLWWTNSAGFGFRNAERINEAPLFKLPQKRYMKLDLNQPVEYHSSVFFSKSQSLLSVLDRIHQAAEDNGVDGVAVNFAGSYLTPAFAYEIHKELAYCKAHGKKVVVFLEQAGIVDYGVASVADYMVIDPVGSLSFQGFVLSRTYLKGLLAQLGIGFEEWRYFKYKSGKESYSRESMSEADREQKQVLLRGMFESWQSAVMANRAIPSINIEHLMNDEIALSALSAKKEKLVDATGRWIDIDDILKKYEKSEISYTEPALRFAESELDHRDSWENKPQMALLYAVGVCDTETGIKAYDLARQLRCFIKDDDIKAIVIRVDSPGGSAVAADMVAEEIRTCTSNKPIIISQGDQAASGGYWLSMYGKKILTTPFTYTGSIGVIGGWFYNTGLKKTLGLSTDYVAIGKHADLSVGMFGFLPDRNLDSDEQSKIKSNILESYNGFIERVGSGRNLSTANVDSIGQGRVWLGSDAIKQNLADDLGNLMDALLLAKKMAHIAPDKSIDLLQYPEQTLFDFSGGMDGQTSTLLELANSKVYQDLMFRFKHRGEATMMLPFGEY